MTFSQMLDALADYYQKKNATGCVSWWEKQPIDQFQKNNDVLEQMIPNLGFNSESEAFYKQHLEKQIALVDYYLANRNEVPKTLQPIDAFMMAKSDSNKDDFIFVEQAVNKSKIACTVCGSKKNLDSKTDYENGTVEFFCKGKHLDGYNSIYDGDHTTEQRFKDYVARKKFDQETYAPESTKNHKLEFDVLFTKGDKIDKIKKYKTKVIDEKEANLSWDDL